MSPRALSHSIYGVADIAVLAGQEPLYRHLDGTRAPPRDLDGRADTD